MPFRFTFGIFAVLALANATHTLAGEPVTMMSLLRQMTDRDRIERYPVHDFRLKQASSYNRASKTPKDPKGWFNNYGLLYGFGSHL